ncbi:MAG: ABC transporter permease [Chitinophagaceae bacterium]|nr:ABC transporter permease [Chitinophagaceae bacterium]
MDVASFIAKRIAFSRQKSFSRFIIRLAIAATAISVMIMIIAVSLANGFKNKVSQKVFSFIGHLRIVEKEPDRSIIAEETPILKNDTLEQKIRKLPYIKGIHPYANRYAILKTREDLEGVIVKGLRSEEDFSHLLSFIKQGRPLRYNDSTYSREIVLSSVTAERLKLKLNDKVLIYFIRPDGSLRPDKLTIAGIYKTGIEEYDKTFALADMKLIQRLNEWNEDEISGYEIFIDNYRNMEAASSALYELPDFPPTWNTLTARDISPNIFDWLALQDKNTMVLLIIISVVAVINLITCFLILVLERVRMIGVLKSLGATDFTVQKIFLHHAAIISATGISLGAILALVLLWAQMKTGFLTLKEEAYYISTVEVQIIGWQVALICFGALFITMCVLLIPSLLVKKVQPVQAIHFR